MSARDFIENVPNFGRLALDHFLRATHGVDITEIFPSANDERLEQNQSHLLRQTTLMKLEFGSDHDHGAAGVIDALAQQILTETSAFTFEHVAEGLQRTIAGAGDGTAVAAVGG